MAYSTRESDTLRGSKIPPEQRSTIKAAAKPKSRLTIIFGQLRQSRTAMFGLAVVLVFVLMAAVGPLIVPHDPYSQSLADRLSPPSTAHWLGTDQNGRDMLSRIVLGARYTLLLSLSATTIAASIGATLGLISAFYGRFVDLFIMRIVDILLALPSILLALIVVAMLGVGMVNLVIAISIEALPAFVRLARGSTLSAKETDYVLAARAIGARSPRILAIHIFPNITAPLIVQYSLRIATVMLLAASLSFLGLGTQPPTPEWGVMLSEARTYMRVSPHLAVFPGIAIMLVVLGLNLLGDGLRDALDPYLRR